VAIEQAAQRLLQADDPPTAVLVYDTILAASLCRQLLQGGRRIPQDISVAGVVGHQSRTDANDYTVTGSQVLFEEMGRLAMQALTGQACGRMPSEPIIQRIGARFCVGTTTAAARG
jgi:LacI family transcriptional regulator